MNRTEFLHRAVEKIRSFADVRAALVGALHDPDLAAQLGPRVRVLAFGKASVEMAQTAADVLQANATSSRIVEALVVGVPERLPSSGIAANIRFLPADHPLPTQRNIEAAKAVLGFVEANADGDTLLVMISGGGSAHLCWPDSELTLEDLREVTRGLQRAGADIYELNAVRKHCERLKGGRLGAALTRGRGTALVVSDVIGDRLDVISSGPMVPDESTFADAMDVLNTHLRATGSAVDAVRRHLERGLEHRLPETPKPGEATPFAIEHRIVASNATLLRKLPEWLEREGVHADVREAQTGDSQHIARGVARWLVEHAEGPRRALVVGGEWTVRAESGDGVGGPSLELALATALQVENLPEVAVLAYATDGIDGPTDAAGAIVDGQTALRIRRAGVDPHAALDRHDSLTALGAAGAVIRTGPTGTNLNHVVVALAGA